MNTSPTAAPPAHAGNLSIPIAVDREVVFTRLIVCLDAVQAQGQGWLVVVAFGLDAVACDRAPDQEGGTVALEELRARNRLAGDGRE